MQKQQAQKFAHDPAVRDLSRQGSDINDIHEEPAIVIPKGDQPQSRHANAYSDKERQGATSASNEKDNTIEKLRVEIFDLKVDNAGKQNFIRQLVTDREQLMGEVKQISYQLGAAQTRVAQLEGPKITYDKPRQAASQSEEPVVDEPFEPEKTPAAAEPAPLTYRTRDGTSETINFGKDLRIALSPLDRHDLWYLWRSG